MGDRGTFFIKGVFEMPLSPVDSFVSFWPRQLNLYGTVRRKFTKLFDGQFTVGISGGVCGGAADQLYAVRLSGDSNTTRIYRRTDR